MKRAGRDFAKSQPDREIQKCVDGLQNKKENVASSARRKAAGTMSNDG
jgi:hypothetical protein